MTLALGVACGASYASATVYTANPGTNLSALYGSLKPGDTLQLNPGTYTSGYYPIDLSGVTITSTNPVNPAILSGAGMQLFNASNVTVSNLIFQNIGGNFIQGSDGGDYSNPATNLTFRNLVFRNPVSAAGYTIGIK